MLVFMAESDDFVFNTGAVTGTNPLNHARVQRRQVQVVSDNFPGFFTCIGNPAGNLLLSRFPTDFLFGEMFHVEHILLIPCVVKTKKGRFRIPGLLLEAGKIDGSAQNTGWGSGFQAGQFNPCVQKTRRKAFCAEVAHAPAFTFFLTDMHQCPEKGAGGYHQTGSPEFNPQVGSATDHPTPSENEPCHGSLE